MDKNTIRDGLVKGVLSGDTIIISGKVDKNSEKAPEEHILSLSLVNAPRTYNNSSKEEEPLGLESRNFLRGLVCGKVVKYLADSTQNERLIGQIFLDNKNISLEIVKKGYARVSNLNKNTEHLEKSDYYGKLKSFESEAKKKKEGVWADKSELEKLKRNFSRYDDKAFDFKDVESKLKGKEVEVMVEHVVNCSGYVLFVKNLNCLIRFTHRFLAIPNSTREPVVTKAGKAFVERLILHRDFKVTIHGLDENNYFVGDIHGVKGELSHLVLRGGYTKLFLGNWTVSPEELTNLKNAQSLAQSDKIRLWKNYLEIEEKGSGVTTSNERSQESFEGTCVQVHSGDCIQVRPNKTNETIRVFLSHLRAPKFGNANNNESDQPWAFQSKDFLRKLLIGNKVKCDHDSTKEITSENKEKKVSVTREMSFFTVIKVAESDKERDLNVNVEILRHGFAEFKTPKKNDTEVSKFIDDFNNAFNEAKTKSVGMHSNKQPKIYNFADLFAANKTKIKEFKDILVGLRGVPCMVDHVITGGRFKLRLDGKNCLIPFNLLGLKTFHYNSNTTDLCNKIYQSAVNYANDTILQREAVCDIIQADRVGNYFGYISINGASYGAGLLKNGLAVVHAGNFAQLGLFSKAEETARTNKAGVWNYDGLISLLKEGVEDTNKIKLFEKQVDSLAKVTEFVDFSEFYVNFSPNKTMDKILSILDEYNNERKKFGELSLPIRKGTLCAARYYDDGCFYRANVLSNAKDNKYEVEFVDFGSIEEVDVKDLIKLDNSIAEFEYQANSCELAFLKLSTLGMKKALVTYKTFGTDPSKEYVVSSFYSFTHESRNKQGVVVYNTKDRDIVKSLQYDLLYQGLAKLTNEKSVPESIRDKLVEAQKNAQTKGLGMWIEADESHDEDN